MLDEMQEFAQIPTAAQRYIRRSLEASTGRWEWTMRLARSPDEARSIDRQIDFYSRLDAIRSSIPIDDDATAVAGFIAMAAELTAFDLGEQKVRTFAAYRFLYERLLGATARPWLLSLFAMCAALPHLDPKHRLELLGSIDKESAAGPWSMMEPQFHPDWVDRLDG